MSDDERVTLRLDRDDLELLDVFVELRMFPNRSEAIRRAIKDLIQNRAGELEAMMVARQKLMESAATLQNLRASLEEQREKKAERDSVDVLKKLGRR